LVFVIAGMSSATGQQKNKGLLAAAPITEEDKSSGALDRQGAQETFSRREDWSDIKVRGIMGYYNADLVLT
jgi:hypothetical protein